MLSIILFEQNLFPAADFEIEETTLKKLPKEEYNALLKMQSDMNNLMGTYDEFTNQYNKHRSAEEQFNHWKKNNAFVFVLRKKEDRKIIGHSIVINVFDKICHISELYLDKNYRSGGLGKMFLAKVENAMKVKGYKSIQLYCLTNNEAGNKLYKSAGYSPSTSKYSKKL